MILGIGISNGGSNGWGGIRFKGATWSPGFRLYKMGARYYDPDVGRFISEDPAGIEAGLNLYAFADADPVNGYDPTGAFSFKNIVNLGPILAIAAMTLSLSPGPLTFLQALGGAMENSMFTAVGSFFAAGFETFCNGG